MYQADDVLGRIREYARQGLPLGKPSASESGSGNVTGSNSVNVFLGLGLPWLMGAVYWGGADDTKKAEWAEKYKPRCWCGKCEKMWEAYTHPREDDDEPSSLKKRYRSTITEQTGANRTSSKMASGSSNETLVW